MRFVVTEYIRKFMKVADDWQNVEVEKKYKVDNWDDLMNLLGTLIDFTDNAIKFEVKKEDDDE